jgi:2-keto-4-pentenoate hydratase/2-oxohepta-3-ene-1,7-dioic acid hydratase in catechol pathway
MQKVVVGARTVTPSKIVCVGRNYVDHIRELGNDIPDEMVVFFKPNSAITSVLYSTRQETLHYETEICFVIERGEFSAVGCGLDLTKRDLQSRLKSKGLPWERAKAFDGAALFSPFVSLPDYQREIGVELIVNGNRRQHGSTTHMMYSPQTILAELKTFLTFEDGDIIMTGTPAGVGPVVAGESYEARILDGDKVLSSCIWQAM